MNHLEINLWVKIKEGDLKAFELLFNSYQKGMNTYAFDLIGNWQDAEEIVQDVFQGIWMKKETLQIHTSLKQYLFRSVHNQCITMIRQKKVIIQKSTAFENETIMLAATGLVAKEEFALDQLVASELEQEIDVAINSLPHQCREVFYNSRFENLSIREVADKLHLSESTVKTQLWRAIEKLREMLKHHL
jgi:RNA polymerase sigma-70 factor (ECF subfamily)